MRLPRSFPEMKADGKVQRTYGKNCYYKAEWSRFFCIVLISKGYDMLPCYALCSFANKPRDASADPINTIE